MDADVETYQDVSRDCNETYVFYTFVNIFIIITYWRYIKIYKLHILCMLSFEIYYFMEKGINIAGQIISTETS